LRETGLLNTQRDKRRTALEATSADGGRIEIR
jgi:hypothetical protein